MFNEVQLEEVKEFLRDSTPESRVYLGCDSQRVKKHGVWHALFTVVVVVHRDGRHGCKLFGYNELEKDNDKVQGRPFNRLFMEAQKVAELHSNLEYDMMDMADVEIHLDINPDQMHGSSCAVKSAAGFILGTTGIEAKIKPDAFAASYAADRLVRGLSGLGFKMA